MTRKLRKRVSFRNENTVDNLQMLPRLKTRKGLFARTLMLFVYFTFYVIVLSALQVSSA